MAWRDKLQKGSFRGAPFLWQKADGEVGRKSARHDYPLRDEAYIEDLGKAPREFTLEVFVLGADYMAARDRLIAACEEPGPGALVHPTMGTLRVALSGKVRISESTAEGGMARFTLPFVQAGDNKYPTATADTAGAVATRADAALGKVRDDFGRTFDVTAKPGYVTDVATALCLKAIDHLDRLRATIPTGFATPPFIAALRGVSSSLASLLRAPLVLAASLQGGVGGLGGLFDEPLAALNAYRTLFAFGDDLQPVPRTTANRRRQADNQQALVYIVRRIGVIEACRTASQADYPSYQDAVAIRDELADRLDEQMESAIDDATYQALTDLRTAMVRDITARGADLARIVAYTPRATLPALVVAHTLYGDAERADELVARNRVRHPGFVPGGTPLEVLTNA